MKKLLLIILSILFLHAQYAFSGDSKEKPRVPQWAKDAVWYQIFPERFANGDLKNDPTPHDMAGAWPYGIPEGWQISPWTSDWYELQPWEKANGHVFYWNSGVRRYGGDLQGIIDHLDYLQDLGVTAIYLNPIFESPSSHKYDTRMYHHIDNNFGPDPKGDEELWASENPADPKSWKWSSADKLFLRLIQEVHKRGMKIIIDGVFNHVGTSFWAFEDLVKNQQKSVFRDWFRIRTWDNPATPENEFEYIGWNGVKDLPEINKRGKNDIADGFADHVHAIVRRWMDPNADGDPSDGIDGWRLDVAEKVSVKFWREFRSWVKEINPNGYITGEIWWENWPVNQMFDAAPWLQGDSFDGVMNYRFARAVGLLVGGVKSQITPEAFADTMKTLEKEYPKENLEVIQNMLDSHDVDRIGSQMVNTDRWYDHAANPGQNKDYSARKPNAIEILKQKLIVGIQMTMLGAPMVYYGDEAGMWGGDDPDCRKPMVWPGISYQTEIADPLGRERLPDSVSFSNDMFQWYKKLIGIRKSHSILSQGEVAYLKIENGDHVLGYQRTLGNSSIFVFANSSNARESFSTEIKPNVAGKQFVNLLDGRIFANKDQHLQLDLSPYELLILGEK